MMPRKQQPVLLWLCLALCLHRTLSARVNDASLLSLFTFTEGQDNINAPFAYDSVASAPLGRLQINLQTSQWARDSTGVQFSRLGLSRPRVTSERNSTRLLDSFSTSGAFTWEIWIAPASSTFNGKTTEALIAGFGQFPVDALWKQDCQNDFAVLDMGGLRLIQIGRRIQIQYATQLPGGAAYCDQLSFQYTNVTQVVLSWAGGTSAPSFYVNGQLITTGTTPYLRYFYDFYGEGTIFQISPKASAPSRIPTTSWLGKVLLNAFYDRALTTVEVAANYNAFLPNSRPFAPNFTVTALQNIQQQFLLSVTDFDNQYGPVPQIITYYVYTPPAIGSLLFYNSSSGNFSTVPYYPYTFTSPSQQLAYQPALNVFGNQIAQVTYGAFDGIVFSRNATCFFTVTHVNQPPVATAASTDVFFNAFSPVQLKGTDVDIVCCGDQISGAIITSLPATGYLFQTNDTLLPGAPILQVPTVVTDSRQRVLFLVNSSGLLVSGVDVLSTTSFTFRVVDASSLPSVSSAQQTLSIRNQLQATAFDDYSFEDYNTTLQLRYRDYANRNTTVDYFLSGAPSQGGRVFYPNWTQITSFPALIPGGSVIYMPLEHMYGYPLETLPYFVQYSTSDPELPGFRSGTALVTLTVYLVYHHPDVAISPSQPIVSLVNAKPKTQSTLFSVQLTSIDPELPWLCWIETFGAGAVVSFQNASIRGEMVFSRGDGASDSAMYFSAPRSVVVRALADMVFIGSELGDKLVQITVNDQNPVKPLNTTMTIRFSVVRNAEAEPASSNVLPQQYIILAWIALLLVPTSCCAVYAFQRYRIFQQDRGRSVLSLPGIVECLLTQWRAVKFKKTKGDPKARPIWAVADEPPPDNL